MSTIKRKVYPLLMTFLLISNILSPIAASAVTQSSSEASTEETTTNSQEETANSEEKIPKKNQAPEELLKQEQPVDEQELDTPTPEEPPVEELTAEQSYDERELVDTEADSPNPRVEMEKQELEGQISIKGKVYLKNTEPEQLTKTLIKKVFLQTKKDDQSWENVKEFEINESHDLNAEEYPFEYQNGEVEEQQEFRLAVDYVIEEYQSDQKTKMIQHKANHKVGVIQRTVEESSTNSSEETRESTNESAQTTMPEANRVQPGAVNDTSSSLGMTAILPIAKAIPVLARKPESAEAKRTIESLSDDLLPKAKESKASRTIPEETSETSTSEASPDSSENETLNEINPLDFGLPENTEISLLENKVHVNLPEGVAEEEFTENLAQLRNFSEERGYQLTGDVGLETRAADQTITIDDIEYSVANNEARVRYFRPSAGAGDYNLVIPSTIEVDGEEIEVTAIGIEGSYYSICSPANTVKIRSVEIPEQVKSIASCAFRNVGLVGELTIPNSVTSIESSSFSNNQITGINFPDQLQTIGGSAFSSNQISGELTIPASVTSIGASSFRSNQITGINFPDQLQRIEENAFSSNQIGGELTIPNSVTSIGSSSFRSNQITGVNFPDQLQTIEASAFSSNQISGELTIPASVTSIGASSFRSNQITGINFPDQLQRIEENAFSSNQIGGELTIPNSVTSIGSSSFRSNQITGINFPDQLRTIAESVFQDNQIEGTLTIPASITSIGTSAFENNRLTELEISGESVIKNYAFRHNQLTSVRIPDTMPNENVKSGAFANNRISSFNFPSLWTYIPDQLFKHNQFEILELPATIRRIGMSAFSDNEISSLTLPDELMWIEQSAFKNNELEHVTIPKKVDNILISAFEENKLTQIDFEADEEREEPYVNIHENAFKKNKLESLTLPKHITAVVTGSFADNELKEVTIETTQLIHQGCFSRNSDLKHVTFTNPNLSEYYESGSGFQGFSRGWNDETDPVFNEIINVHIPEQANMEEWKSYLVGHEAFLPGIKLVLGKGNYSEDERAQYNFTDRVFTRQIGDSIRLPVIQDYYAYNVHQANEWTGKDKITWKHRTTGATIEGNDLNFPSLADENFGKYHAVGTLPNETEYELDEEEDVSIRMPFNVSVIKDVDGDPTTTEDQTELFSQGGNTLTEALERTCQNAQLAPYGIVSQGRSCGDYTLIVSPLGKTKHVRSDQMVEEVPYTASLTVDNDTIQGDYERRINAPEAGYVYVDSEDQRYTASDVSSLNSSAIFSDYEVTAKKRAGNLQAIRPDTTQINVNDFDGLIPPDAIEGDLLTLPNRISEADGTAYYVDESQDIDPSQAGVQIALEDGTKQVVYTLATGMQIERVPQLFDFGTVESSDDDSHYPLSRQSQERDGDVYFENVDVDATWSLSAKMSKLKVDGEETYLNGSEIKFDNELKKESGVSWLDAEADKFDTLTENEIRLPADDETTVELFKVNDIAYGQGRFRNQIDLSSVELFVPRNQAERGKTYQGEITWTLNSLP